MKHSLCGMTFTDVDVFNRHVGYGPGPTFKKLPPLCGALPLPERNKATSDAQYRDAENQVSEPATGAGSSPLKRNTPGRKRVYVSDAAKQRAYRERKRSASRDS